MNEDELLTIAKKTRKDQSTASLRREIADLKYQLAYIQAGRLNRSITFFLRFFRDPAKAFRKINEFPTLFKKLSMEKLSEEGRAAIGPEPLAGTNPLLRYPNFKVACLGTADRFSKVAHSYELLETDWKYLLSLRVDLLAVDAERYETTENAKSIIDEYLKAGVPIVVYSVTGKVNEYLQKAATLVLSDSVGHSDSDKPYIDITRHNPIRWSNHFTDEDFDNLVISQSDFDSDKQFISTLLTRCSKGDPVVVKVSSKKVLKSVADLPVLAGDEGQVNKHLESLKDPDARESYSIKLRRHVHLNYSQLNYMDWLLVKLNFQTSETGTVSIIASTVRPDNVELIINSVKDQDFAQKQLVLVLHGDGFDPEKTKKQLAKLDFPSVVITRPKDSIFGDNLNLALDQCTGDYITKMDDDDYYGPQHLNDLYAAYLYSGAEIVGKWSNWVYLQASDQTISWAVKRQEAYGGHLPGATIFCSANTLKSLRFGSVKRAIDSELYARLLTRGGRLYSTHRYNFIRVRHDDHTYKTDDQSFISNSSGTKYKGLDVKKHYA